MRVKQMKPNPHFSNCRNYSLICFFLLIIAIITISKQLFIVLFYI